MSVKRNIVANYAGQIFSSLISLLLVPVYIRYLGVEAYALVGLFAVIQMWLSLLDLGMTPTLSREMARFQAGATDIQFIRNLLRSLELICLVIAIVIASVLLGASDWLAHNWLQVEKLSPETAARAIAIIGAVVALKFAESIYRSAIIGLQQQIWLNAAYIILGLMRGGGAVIILAFMSPTIEAFFIWQGLVSALTLVVMGARVHFALPSAPHAARFSGAALAEVRRFASGMIGITLVSLLVSQADKLLLSRLLPLKQFGFYMIAATLAGTFLMIVSPVVQAIYPAFVRLAMQNDQDRLSASYHQSAQLVTVLVVPAALIMILFPHGLIMMWSGNPELAANAAPILMLLAFGSSINALLQVPAQMQIAHGWTSLMLWINVGVIATLIPSLFIFVPRYGPIAAALVWALANTSYIVTLIVPMHRRILRGEMWRWYIDDLTLPTIAAVAVFVPVALVVHAQVLSRTGWFLVLAATGTVGIAAAALAANLIRPRVARIARTLYFRLRQSGAVQ